MYNTTRARATVLPKIYNAFAPARAICDFYNRVINKVSESPRAFLFLSLPACIYDSLLAIACGSLSRRRDLRRGAIRARRR